MFLKLALAGQRRFKSYTHFIRFVIDAKLTSLKTIYAEEFRESFLNIVSYQYPNRLAADIRRELMRNELSKSAPLPEKAAFVLEKQKTRKWDKKTKKKAPKLSKPGARDKLTIDEDLVFLQMMLESVDRSEMDDFVLGKQSTNCDVIILKIGQRLKDFSPSLLKLHWLTNLRVALRRHVESMESQLLSLFIQMEVPSKRKINWLLVLDFFPTVGLQSLRSALKRATEPGALESDTSNLPLFEKLRNRRIPRICHRYDQLKGVFERL